MKKAFLAVLMMVVSSCGAGFSWAEDVLLFRGEQRILTEDQVQQAFVVVEEQTLEGISAAEANDSQALVRHVNAARSALKLVVGDQYGPVIQRVAGHLRIASHKGKKNDNEAALVHLDEALRGIAKAKTRTLQPPIEKRW